MPTRSSSSDEAPLRADDHEPAHDLRLVLSSIGETLYTWDIGSDSIAWGSNASGLLRHEGGRIASGRAWAQLTIPDAGLSRYDVVTGSTDRDTGHGVVFQTRYAITTPEAATMWLEDTGRWFGGFDGRPARVHGVVRVVPGDFVASQGPNVDVLTGALTRQQLMDMINDEIVQARRQHKSLALALVGIDGLAALNEAYGFDVADEVIAGIAQRLRMVLRRGDALGRASGNKLGLVLMGCAEEQLGIAAMRFIDAVREAPISTSAGPIAASVRLGAALLPRFGQTAALAMQHAEEALADAKVSPTRLFVAYAPDRRRDERRQSNRRFTDEVVTALNERRVNLALEPIVSAGTRQIAFHEALVRVARPDGTVMPPGQIVPLIEKLGFMPLLDHRVLELATNRLEADPSLHLSINVSNATAREPDWMAALAGRFAPRPEIARRMTVEITETFAMDDVDATSAITAAMRDLGLRVALDDFGAGHTSFRHLRQLSLDIVKIDGVFVQNLQRSTDDRFFVRTLLDLARHLQVQVVAEWVRDEETAALLESWGVDYLQGELFGQAKLEPGPVLDQPESLSSRR